MPTKGVSVVYFLRSAGLIKIGTTDNLRSRLRAIRSTIPTSLRLLAFGPGCEKREHHLHELLADTRSHGEWFRPSPLLRFCMREAAANTWAWEHLPPWTEPLAEGPITLEKHERVEFEGMRIGRRLERWHAAFAEAVASGHAHPRWVAGQAVRELP